MLKLRSLVIAAGVAVAASGTSTSSVEAYPIDCAILLCLAGGFPPSAECTAAKAEVIRRITPIPVEPPLQLWNCPMGVDAETASLIGFVPNIGADGLVPEVRAYRDAIELYDIDYEEIRREDHDETRDNTRAGAYNEAGDFFWRSASFPGGPEWLSEAVGGFRVPIYEYYGRDNQYRRIIGYANRPGFMTFGPVRGVAMRYQDHTGQYHTEYVPY